LSYLLFSSPLFSQIKPNGEQQLRKCKQISLESLKNNIPPGEDLSNCLYDLAFKGKNESGDYYSKIFADWQQQVLSDYKTNMSKYLSLLEQEKQDAAAYRNQIQNSNNALLQNAVQATTQNYINSRRQTNTMEKSNCVNGPGRGCGQR
ncbi:hypothetical protein, partial [Elizabethkingia anophelis]|uniref:hypothetical protein n=1 Tax=Elizabethkingia anophelis TaxID=1117645 RepID=UPI003891EC2A